MLSSAWLDSTSKFATICPRGSFGTGTTAFLRLSVGAGGIRRRLSASGVGGADGGPACMVSLVLEGAMGRGLGVASSTFEAGSRSMGEVASRNSTWSSSSGVSAFVTADVIREVIGRMTIFGGSEKIRGTELLVAMFSAGLISFLASRESRMDRAITSMVPAEEPWDEFFSVQRGVSSTLKAAAIIAALAELLTLLLLPLYSSSICKGSIPIGGGSLTDLPMSSSGKGRVISDVEVFSPPSLVAAAGLSVSSVIPSGTVMTRDGRFVADAGISEGRGKSCCGCKLERADEAINAGCALELLLDPPESREGEGRTGLVVITLVDVDTPLSDSLDLTSGEF
mmetsp:Transcript_17545/g.27931  ORF Transcript_17545/g.27931 Transcript_17545/m.27931 type:complete len:339 (-) Transcript_17545:1479-2495(-)